jgi:hypothetical protein
VLTARYALSPYIKQIRFVFKGLNTVCHAAAERGSLEALWRWAMKVQLKPGQSRNKSLAALTKFEKTTW